MIEIGFILFVIATLGALIYISKEYGGAIAEKDAATEELREVGEIIKGAAKNEAQISSDYATGKPRRMRGKYDID